MSWRVGDGNHIRIWEDAWIPAGVTRRPRTPRGNIVISKVSELIDPIRGTWDSELINDLFWEEDVSNILSIPVHMDREDSVAWHFNKKGVFSVKSAYHVLEDEAETKLVRQKGETSRHSLNSGQKMWNKLWGVPVPPKIKQCVWRVAHNSLAHKMNIKSKKISLDTRCPVCFRYDEDGAHCFFKCKEVRKVWRELGLENIRLKLANLLSAMEVVAEILRQREDMCIVVFVLIWKWWSVRNKVNVGELMPSAQTTVSAIRDMVQDILKEGSRINHHQSLEVQQGWLPPAEGILKINIDGSFMPGTSKGAWGFVIRSHDGAIVIAGAGSLGPVHDALMAKMMACKFAVEAAIQLGIAHGVIETDSSQLREGLTSSEFDLSVAGGLFQDIRASLHEDFLSLNVTKIHRSCNSLAHELAAMGQSWDPGQYHHWIDPLPDFVIRLNTHDLAEYELINIKF